MSLTRVLSTLATVPAGTLVIAAAYCLVLCLCELLPLERFLATMRNFKSADCSLPRLCVPIARRSASTPPGK